MIAPLLAAALLAATSPTSTSLHTLALYNMWEATGQTVLVDSTNGMNGTIGAHVTLGGSVHTYPLLSDNAVDPAHIDVVDRSELIPGDRDYTITVRLRYHYTVGNVLNYGQSGGPYIKFVLEGAGGGIACQFVGTAGSAEVAYRTPLNDMAYHVVACRRTADKVRMYVDGALVGARAHATGNISPRLPLSIGGKSKCNGYTVACDYFAGQIDWIRIEAA